MGFQREPLGGKWTWEGNRFRAKECWREFDFKGKALVLPECFVGLLHKGLQSFHTLPLSVKTYHTIGENSSTKYPLFGTHSEVMSRISNFNIPCRLAIAVTNG